MKTEKQEKTKGKLEKVRGGKEDRKEKQKQI